MRFPVALFLVVMLAAPAADGDGPPPGDLDFDLMGGDAHGSPVEDAARARRLAAIDRAVRRRRPMLQAHQALGFVTLGLLAATLVIGQLNYVDKYGGGDDNGRFYAAHLGLGVTTTLSFTATGLVALFAPNPYPKPVRADAALLHKVSMALAAAGMVTQLVLGPVTAAHEGRLDQRDYALAHLVTGYATFAFMATGVLAYVF
jgi:hypothetical protein